MPSLSSMYRFQWEEAQSSYVCFIPRECELSAQLGNLNGLPGKLLSTAVSDLETEFPGSDLESDVFNFLTEAKKNGWISF